MLGYAAQIREHANLLTVMLQYKLCWLSSIVRDNYRIHHHAFHLEGHVTIKRGAAKIFRSVF